MVLAPPTTDCDIHGDGVPALDDEWVDGEWVDGVCVRCAALAALTVVGSLSDDDHRPAIADYVSDRTANTLNDWGGLMYMDELRGATEEDILGLYQAGPEVVAELRAAIIRWQQGLGGPKVDESWRQIAIDVRSRALALTRDAE